MSVSHSDRYAEAKALTLGSGKVSFTFIQRMMGVGHHVALEFIDRMEAEEFISLPIHGGTRKVLARDLKTENQGAGA